MGLPEYIQVFNRSGKDRSFFASPFLIGKVYRNIEQQQVSAVSGGDNVVNVMPFWMLLPVVGEFGHFFSEGCASECEAGYNREAFPVVSNREPIMESSRTGDDKSKIYAGTSSRLVSLSILLGLLYEFIQLAASRFHFAKLALHRVQLVSHSLPLPPEDESLSDGHHCDYSRGKNYQTVLYRVWHGAGWRDRSFHFQNPETNQRWTSLNAARFVNKSLPT
jgi:hypothetical protein